MEFDLLGKYLIPILYIYFAYRFLRKPAAFGEREGFSTKRARESEEIWNFVQRAAGIYCVAAGIALAVLAYLVSAYLTPEQQSAVYWYQIGIEMATIVLLIPVVNLATNLKFPKK